MVTFDWFCKLYYIIFEKNYNKGNKFLKQKILLVIITKTSFSARKLSLSKTLLMFEINTYHNSLLSIFKKK